MQVLVPGKQNYSLAITWALDHDPVETVEYIMSGGATEEATPAPNGSHNLPGAAILAQRSLNMRKSRSLQDAAKVTHQSCWPFDCKELCHLVEGLCSNQRTRILTGCRLAPFFNLYMQESISL